MITMGSLFDGIGGFPLAAVRFGIVPLWASEIEAFPIEVTKERFPDMIHVGDITKLNGAELPPVNIICGGSPCQDLSVAGARAGLAGGRSGLFMEQIRIMKEMRDADLRAGRPALLVRPRFLVWENVPGAFSSGEPKGEDFRIVLEEIVRIKYGAVSIPRPDAGRWESAGGIVLGDEFSLCWRVLDAQFWGVAQRRRRVFLVADFTGRSALQILFEQDRLPGYPAPRFGAWEGFTASTQGSADAAGRADDGQRVKDRTVAFAANQRDEVRDLHDVAGALGAQPGMKQQTFVAAAFSVGAGSSAGGIGYTSEGSPTLKGSEGGNMVPAVLCLNDQGGERMDTREDVSGTLRSEEHGHQPLVLASQQGGAEIGVDLCPTITSAAGTSGNNQPVLFENHGIDARYTGPHPVAPTMSARYGTGGNNVPLVEQEEPESYCIVGNVIDRQPHNGGNGKGYQANLAYTLTGMDPHAVFSRKRVDVFRDDEIASTESARQHKDATDLILQQTSDEDHTGQDYQHISPDEPPRLIRRLTPLECERLQGFPDGWTDLPGACDAARYKALGNSVAIPCVEYVMAGIAAALADTR